MTQKWKSHSNNYTTKNKIFELQRVAGNNLELILQHFRLDDLRKLDKFYVGRCPIHGGDNDSAFNIFHSGNQVIGNWRCFTHHCENHFQSSIIGFVRGIISKTKYEWKKPGDNECSFKEALDFVLAITGSKSFDSVLVDQEFLEKQRFASNIESFTEVKTEEPLNIPREKLRTSLIVPSPYFLSRGVPEYILDKYDIGCCRTPGKEMNMRAVVPIYDDDYTVVIGCSGRSIFEKCPICNAFHNPIQECPEGKLKGIFRKWKHNKGFRADRHLYNYWFSKDYIRESKVAVLVEGPGDVWKLEEAGIHNSVAIFGSALSDGQRNILDKSGALALVVLTDPDQAGKVCIQEITKQCSSTYSIFSPSFGSDDIGDTPLYLIKEKLIPIIKNIQKDLE